MVEAARKSEAAVMPSAELLAAMGIYNELLACTGILAAGAGLQPSSKDRRMAFDGPFAQSSGLVTGFWLWEVKDMAHAVEWVKSSPNPTPGYCDIETRPVFEAADFGEVLTPEVADLGDQIRAKRTGP